MTQLTLVARDRAREVGDLIHYQVAQPGDEGEGNGHGGHHRDCAVEAESVQELDQGCEHEGQQECQRQRDEHVLGNLQDGNDHDHRQQDDAGSRGLA